MAPPWQNNGKTVHEAMTLKKKTKKNMTKQRDQNTKRESAMCRCALMRWESVCVSSVWGCVAHVLWCGQDPKPVAYLTGDGLKIEARQFNYVSQFKYGTEWWFLWVEEAFADVGWINALHQVTPENHISHSKALRARSVMSHSALTWLLMEVSEQLEWIIPRNCNLGTTLH